jgi:hypothetical protein
MVDMHPTFSELPRSPIGPERPMTEEVWWSCDNPEIMLESVRPRASKRKLRLFAAACFRRLARLLPDDRQQQAINLLEDAPGEDVFPRGAVQRLRLALPSSLESFGGKCSDTDDPYFVGLMLYREFVSSSAAHHATVATRGLADCVGERQAQCRLLRCILGPLPFRTISVSPAMRTATVIALAQTVYQDKAFEQLPILADAMETTGCGESEIVNHLRQPGPHVRGCWAVDLILGKV